MGSVCWAYPSWWERRGRGQVLSSSERTLKDQFVLPFLLQDEDMQLRKRRNVPSEEGQASSTGEPG